MAPVNADARRTYLRVGGTLFGTLEFRPEIWWEAEEIPIASAPRPPRPGEPSIELLDADGRPLVDAAASVSGVPGCGGKSGVGLWPLHAWIPLHPAAVRAHVLVRDRVVYGSELRDAPQPAGLRFTLESDSLDVIWGPPPSEVELHYRLRCVDDLGRVTNLVDWTLETWVRAPTDRLSRGVDLRIELVASTGTRSRSLLGEPFVLARTEPTIAILEPRDGAILPRGQRTTLIGRAVDNQRNALPARHLTWLVDGVTAGPGDRAVATTLGEVGTHEITLVYDDDETRGAESVSVVVRDA